MQTIGRLLKDARQKKRYSLKKIEEETKIKGIFIEAIEKEDWKSLPDFPIVLGFVKSLSSVLDVNQGTAAALLRRDYPPKAISINPKPDIGNKFVWTPRLTFLAGIGIIIAMFLGYIAFQYSHFTSPPPLSVDNPSENQVVSIEDLTVSGNTDTDAVVLINNQPAIVDADGNFSTTIKINKDTTSVEIKATSRSGRETIVRRTIVPKI